MEDKNISTENREMDAAMAEEMQQAQKTGTVDFSAKKEEKEKSGNYTHIFEYFAPRELLIFI